MWKIQTYVHVMVWLKTCFKYFAEEWGIQYSYEDKSVVEKTALPLFKNLNEKTDSVFKDHVSQIQNIG